MTTQYRAEFDASVTFSNGGGLSTEGFRVDVANADATDEQIAELFVASLNLLMVEQVSLRNVRIFPETHKGTHGGPSDSSSGDVSATDSARVMVELSHVISDGMTTYPG